VQKARKIDTKISKSLLQLPMEVAGNDEHGNPMPKSLPERNMVRGQLTFNLPYGEKLAKDWSFEPIPKHQLVKDVGLDGTPLWFYVLAEAEQLNGKLGPVGGTIVAGVLLNLLLRDQLSIAGKQRPEAKKLAQSDASPIAPAFGSVVEFIKGAA